LAAEIIKALDRGHLTVRRAQPDRHCGGELLAHPQRDLGRFTVDRLISTINRLGSRVEVRVRVRRMEAITHAATGDGVKG
jgi:hypothetical protein